MASTPLKRTAIFVCGAAALVLQLASFMFYGDNAVAGLMAMHIGRLQEFPLYYWGAHYSGTLVSYIAAVFFSILGVSKTACALSAILLSWVWIISQYALARLLLGSAGALAALLVCLFPPFHVLRYATFFGGIYPETFAFSSILFLFAARRISFQPGHAALYYFAAGAAAGFGQWLSPGMLPASAAMLIFFAVAEKKAFWKNCLPFFAAGFAAGCLPAIVYDIEHPLASLYRMGGRLLDVDRSFLNEPGKAGVIAGRIAEKIVSVPRGLMRLPMAYMEAAGLLNLLLLAGGAVLAVKEAAARIREKRFPGAVDIALVYAFVFAAFYALLLSGPASFRYAVPLYIAAPLLLGRAFEVIYGRRRKLAVIILAAAVCFNIFTVLRESGKKELYDIYGLAAGLEKTGLKYAFSDYGTAYLVTFLTKEKIIVSPTLFHADFYDRYPPYTRSARNSPDTAFIINAVTFPGQAELAQARLKELNIRFTRESLGGFVVFSRLSRRVYPEELGLRGPTEPKLQL